MFSSLANALAERFGMNPKEFERFMKFAVVGVIGAVVDFGSFNLMLRYTDLPTPVASNISFVLAIISNFFWNRFWTYNDSRSKSIVGQFVQFFIVSVSGLLIRYPIVRFGEAPSVGMFESFGLTNDLSATLGANFVVAAAVGIVMFWNFFVNRYWTYNDVDS